MSAGLTAVRRAASLLLYASLSNVSMVASMTAIKVRTCGVSSAVASPAAVREVGARTGGRGGEPGGGADGGGGKLQSTVWQSQPLGLAPKMPPTEQLGGGGGGDGEGGGGGGGFGGGGDGEGGSGGRGWEQCAGMLP